MTHLPGGDRSQRLPLLGLVLLAVVLLLAGAGSGLATGLLLARPGPAALTAQRPADPSSLRQVAAVLQSRSQAVRDRDQEAFLRDVTTDDPTFLAEQRRLFTNLAQLNLSRWSYRLVGGQTYNVPLLGDRYHDPFLVVAVQLRYAFLGFDDRPVARALGLTFVWQGGRPLLASDTDVDAQLPEAGHAEPWDLGSVSVAEGSRSLVVGDLTDSAQLPAVAEQADRAVEQVARLWPTGWNRRVVVVVAGDPRVWQTYFRDDRDPVEFAALAVPTFTQVPGWFHRQSRSARLAGSRVVVNPDWFAGAGPGLGLLLRHEVTHVALVRHTGRGTPTWLVEGIAEYTASRGLARAPRALVDEAAAGRLDLTYPSSVSFYTRGVDRNYDVSWALCSAIADRHGEDALVRLFRRMSRVTNPAQAPGVLEEVAPDLLGVTPAGLLRETESWLAARGG
jgi:hypothetical protein